LKAPQQYLFAGAVVEIDVAIEKVLGFMVKQTGDSQSTAKSCGDTVWEDGSNKFSTGKCDAIRGEWVTISMLNYMIRSDCKYRI